ENQGWAFLSPTVRSVFAGCHALRPRRRRGPSRGPQHLRPGEPPPPGAPLRVRREMLAAPQRLVRTWTLPTPRIVVRHVPQELPMCARPTFRPSPIVVLRITVI